MNFDSFNFMTEEDHPLLSRYEGLTTQNALENLRLEISEFSSTIENDKKKRTIFGQILYNSFHHHSYYTTFSWIPIGLLFLFLVSLAAFSLSECAVLIITVLMAVNIGIMYWDNYLRVHEFKHRICYILKLIKKVQKSNSWNPELLPNLYTPNSPSVSLQWTIRDRQLINLPSVLLTKDDIILMRPGQQAPAEIEIIPSESNKKCLTLMPDQLFACDPDKESTDSKQKDIYQSVERKPFEDRVFRVKKSPYIAHLQAMNDKYLNRPPSLYNKARYLLLGKCVHHFSLPICFILCEILAIIRWYVVPLVPCVICTKLEKICQLFVIEVGSVMISLISLTFPFCWFLANSIGNAAVLSCESLLESKEKPIKNNDKLFDVYRESDNPYFIDIEQSPYRTVVSKISKLKRWNTFKKQFLNSITKDGSIVIRCTNFLHTMASVTVLCCVDKKGVLSWPNPTAEKVFFLKNNANYKNHPTSETGSSSFHNFQAGVEKSPTPNETLKSANEGHIESFSKPLPSVEILDITPRDDMGSAWKIEFDDSRWRSHLASLKPLGLAILLNTCNKKTHKSYNQFCAHITNHALFSQHLVPVGNRRCLCELARQIGFNENLVEKEYNLELQLFTYNNLAASQTENKYVQAFFKTRKPKFPFPHATSAVVNSEKSKKVKLHTAMKEKRRKLSFKYKEKQMLSQGTADVILDFCIDYWNGQEVEPLTPALRKKILDFYQRSSLTAYCTAFSYRPVYKHFPIESSGDNEIPTVYLELIKTTEHRQNQKKRRRGRKRHQDLENDTRSNRMNQIFRNEHFFLGHNPHFRNEGGKISLQEVSECDEEVELNECEGEDYNIVEDTECYDYYDDDDDEDYFDDYDNHKEEDLIKNIEKQLQNESSNTISSRNYFQILNKQVFLGMVSMQYQPLHDMVQMVEELEKACIRFVHFSKENELRSRVFSEKMGLESGWNCHISLLSEADTNTTAENISANENTSVAADLESVIETGASSADDEEKVPFTFDMSNRAKLPCGIRNIKPHLEQVDNVPLLVSLFTDCTSNTTEQMLSIMQEYGQVICVLGSSVNVKNFSLFAQADTSISVEPLYAQVCQQFQSPLLTEADDLVLSPIELSQILNSLPCSLTLTRQFGCHRGLPIHPIIAESRNIMRLIWNCSQFWLCSIALTSCVQFLALMLMLPAILTLEQTLWISCVVIPCLSISLANSPYDENIMTKATGKDWLCSVNWTTISYSLYCYGTKIFCGIIFTLVSYIMVLTSTCECLTNYNNSTEMNASVPIAEKFWVYIIPRENDHELRLEYINAITIIQCYMALVITLHLVALCSSFLHRDFVFWKKVPCLNLPWLMIILFPSLLQIAYLLFTIDHTSVDGKMDCMLHASLFSIKNTLSTFIPPFLTFFICEVVKMYEIRSSERYQKKVRLEFGTKLGMNSPF